MLDTDGKPRLRLLLDPFALIEDEREPGRVAYPLPEFLLLVVCGTIAAGDATLRTSPTGAWTIVRHFAFNMLRSINDKRSIKLRRK